MKKTITFIFLGIILSLCFVSCGKASSVPDKNAGGETTLEFWITDDVKDADWSGHDEIYGWMGAREYLGTGYTKIIDADGTDQRPTYYVSYLVTAYPDHADGGQFVTTITVTDPEVKVYGLTVNSTVEEFDAVFGDLGFDLYEGDSTTIYSRIAEKDGISFRLSVKSEGDPDFVPAFTIKAAVTNRTGFVY